MKRAIALGTAAFALVAAPVAAADRSAAPVDGESELGGVSLVVALLGAAAIIAGIVIIADDDDDAVSP